MPAIKEASFRYLTVSPDDKAWGLHVPTTGYTWIQAHSPDYPPEPHPSAYHFEWKKGRILQEFQLIYITRGTGVFESEATGLVSIGEGDAFLLFPGEWHRFAPDPETGWDEYWIGFDGDVPRRLSKLQIISPKSPLFSPGLGGSVQELFTKAIEVMEQETLGYHQILAGIAFELLTRLHAQDRVSKLAESPGGAVVTTVRNLIEQRLHEQIDWDELAQDLQVSYSTLRQAFQRHTGFSPYQYQLQLRLDKAKMLLNTSPLPVKEIARQIGFDCPYHFSSFFKRKIGLSPAAWRHNAHGGGRAGS